MTCVFEYHVLFPLGLSKPENLTQRNHITNRDSSQELEAMGLTYVELSVACSNLPAEKTSDCAVVCCLFRKDGSTWAKLAQTEIVHKSSNPRVSSIHAGALLLTSCR